MQEKKDRQGRVIARVDVGTHIWLEVHLFGHVLKQGKSGFCDYYLPTLNSGLDVPINIDIIGNKVRCIGGECVVQTKITFVDSGTRVFGWVPAVDLLMS